MVTQQAYATKYRGTYKFPASLEAATINHGSENPLVPLPKATTPLLHSDGRICLGWMPLFVTGALKLIDEVTTLVKAAKDVKDPWDGEHPF